MRKPNKQTAWNIRFHNEEHVSAFVTFANNSLFENAHAKRPILWLEMFTILTFWHTVKRAYILI